MFTNQIQYSNAETATNDPPRTGCVKRELMVLQSSPCSLTTHICRSEKGYVKTSSVGGTSRTTGFEVATDLKRSRTVEE